MAEPTFQHQFPPTTLRIVMLVYPNAQLLDVSGPLEVFARTERYLREMQPNRPPTYSIQIAAAEAGPIATSSGVQLVADCSYRDIDIVDTLLIAGGIGFREAVGDSALIDRIAELASGARRTASICTGAFLLAASGLLNGRDGTTHWAYLNELAHAEPACRVNRHAIFVRDGAIYSSAGVTAGMDLALALVEEDLGSAIALAVAQELVMYLKRPGGQAQFSRHLGAQRRDDRFGQLHLWLIERLHTPITVEHMAEQAAMSPRHFARRFAATMGATPAAYLLQLRVEHARSMIEHGSRNLKSIARDAGFASEQNLRRAFVRTLGLGPGDYIARFVR